MTWWMRIDRFLNSQRMTYAWIAGGVLWVAWLVSVLIGKGNMDLAGQVIGTDYLQFYTAGETVKSGHSPELYNFAYQSQLELNIAGAGLTSFHAFITPPFLAWLYIPFTLLPYAWSFIAWSILSLIFLWLSIKLLGMDQPLKCIFWSLTWFPIFAAISFGQNSLLSLFLFSLTFWLWRKEKYMEAGFVSSLLLFKPQLVLGLGVLWLLEWRKSWKSLLGLTIGGGILAGLCFMLLPEASRAYVELARNFIPGMLYQDQFPLWHLHSLRGFWILLFPGQKWLVEGLSLLLSAAGVAVYIYFWRSKRQNKIVLFAGAICLTVWITPHDMIYDWSILLIPAILFWQSHPRLKAQMKSSFFLIWLATFLSGPLTYLQLKVSTIAIQISIPIVAFVFFTYGKSLLGVRQDTEIIP
jgi:alpha-1,2-mannosyltransferase